MVRRQRSQPDGVLSMDNWTTPRLVALAPTADANNGGAAATDGASQQYGNS